MANTSSGNSDGSPHYQIVGRDNRIDLQKYTTRVHGRDIIDYEKLKTEDPTLHQEIVHNEAEADRRHDEYLKEILADAGSAGTLERQLQTITAKSEPDPADKIITEHDLRTICTLAGWQLTWPPDYFATERAAVDIFYDILEPQHKGFVMDWRYAPQALLERIKSCVGGVDVTITKSTLVVKKIKPFNDVLIHHYDIELSAHGEHFFGSFLPEEPDYFIFTILRLAQVKDVQFMHLALGEDAYCFVGFSVSADLHAIAEYLPLSDLTSTSQFIPVDEPTRAKYFYIPVFTTNPKEDLVDSSKSRIDVMAFGTRSYRSPTGFASRVLPGQTLRDAIRADLQKDFHYSGDFGVLDYYLYDTATDKQGNKLPRLIVHIAVDKLATETLKPAGMGAYWVRKDMAYLYKYYQLGFGLEQAPNL